MDELDTDLCRRARLSRDSRFDGEFFLGVTSTGIYCRPICPARAAAEKNVRYFRHASQAAEQGFRPCLRCRPESAPGSPAWRGSSTTVQRALALIQAGALNAQSVAQLAARLGVGERYLRKLFQRELGLSPSAVAQNQRLLFARKLLLETDLSITDIAFAAGYGSVRRFNSAARQGLGAPPGEVRRRQGRHSRAGEVRLLLNYRPPYDWEGVLDFFSRHAISGVEQVHANAYHRQISWHGQSGHFSVTHRPRRQALEVTLALPEYRALMPVTERVRRMFDLDANAAAVAEALSVDPQLAALLARYPGVRSPLCFSPYEASVRAVAGQQISIRAARSVLGRLFQATGVNSGFPEPQALLALADEQFPMPVRRRATLRAVCQLYAADASPDQGSLANTPGVGPWTLAMIALRGHGHPDTLPPGDLGLHTACPQLDQQQRHWRPFRSYAANLLWRSLSP